VGIGTALADVETWEHVAWENTGRLVVVVGHIPVEVDAE
jgi:hypothetical protein